jgi:hypothetical protein
MKTNYNEQEITIIIIEKNGTEFLHLSQLDNEIFIPLFKINKMIKGLEFLLAEWKENNG